MGDNNIYYVYEWIRLDTNEPFYVGKGKNDRWCKTTGRSKYFTSICNKVDTVVHILQENLSENEAFEYECWYINEYRFVDGFSLCNMTDGGEGISGYKHTEEETKRNRMESHGFDIEDHKDEIIDMYTNKEKSSYEISKYFKVSDVIIGRVLKKFGVIMRKGGSVKDKNRGLNRYNSKCILVKDTNNNILNCFESILLCGEWISKIGLTTLSGGGRKAIQTNIDTNINYKGLLFYTINRDEFNEIMSNSEQLVPFIVNDINTKAINNSTIIEVYDKKKNLINTYPSLYECANWLIEIGMSKSFSSGRDAIYRNCNNNKFYKNIYTFKKYTKSEYNEVINKLIS